MQLIVSGVHLDIGQAFQQLIQSEIEETNRKHQIDPIEVHVVVEKLNAYQYKATISAHTARGITIRVYELGPSSQAAFNNAKHLFEERLRRNKKRLEIYHKHRESRRRPLTSSYYVLGVEESEETKSKEDLSPPVIAELEAEIPTLTVGEAVMQLDLSQQPALMFYNESHGGLNMIYRREDGNIGWIDPQQRTVS